MSDPRDFERPGYRDPDLDPVHQRPLDPVDPAEPARGSNAMWGWIAGIAIVIILGALIFGPNRSGDDQTALQNNPAANSVITAPPATGTAINRNPPPPEAMPPENSAQTAPDPTPPVTTGQGSGADTGNGAPGQQ